ncbi:MAG: NAD(P) transhydrogenase subunit alpha [Alphaproteobacteria bacterium]|nr:NAD(P) transhydrogenase subunit alpha [Alphaproteobacteria bacterium]
MDLNTEIMIFILSGFIGYYIVWGITPSLHAPLMSVSNAISGIVILGSIEVINDAPSLDVRIIGFMAALLAAINIFGGFAISQRMLEMFQKKKTRDNK